MCVEDRKNLDYRTIDIKECLKRIDKKDRVHERVHGRTHERI